MSEKHRYLLLSKHEPERHYEIHKLAEMPLVCRPFLFGFTV